MKYLILLCFIIAITTCAMAHDKSSEFYIPSESQGWHWRRQAPHHVIISSTE